MKKLLFIVTAIVAVAQASESASMPQECDRFSELQLKDISTKNDKYGFICKLLQKHVSDASKVAMPHRGIAYGEALHLLKVLDKHKVKTVKARKNIMNELKKSNELLHKENLINNKDMSTLYISVNQRGDRYMLYRLYLKDESIAIEMSKMTMGQLDKKYPQIATRLNPKVILEEVVQDENELWKVQSKNGLRVRKDASKDAGVITSLTDGSSVYPVMTNSGKVFSTNGYMQVKYIGGTGWVSSKYITKSKRK